MPGAADAPQTDAVAALVAVTSCDASPSRGDEALPELIAVVREAARARIGLIWVGDAPEGQDAVAAADGVGGEALGAIADALAAAGVPEEETRIGPGDGPLADALAAAGAPAGLAIPVRVAEARVGACLLAGDEPPAGEPLRLHAARVGASRAGSLLDGLRLRENLERAMAQILATDERMLGRIGLDIHDGPTQQLSVAMLEVQLLEADLADAEEAGGPLPESLRPSLSRIYETVGGALHEMRELIGHLRPAQFEDRRLPDILGDAIAGFEARTDCEVEASWEGEFPVNGVSITQRITLYRILQETLANAHRHGAATRVEVLVREDETGTTLEVRDDGTGFEPAEVQRRRPGMPLARFGLHGMRDRARILGGSFDVESAPGAGATVTVFLPRWRSGAPPEVPVDVA
jgi:signal transduction histidine kinase